MSSFSNHMHTHIHAHIMNGLTSHTHHEESSLTHSSGFFSHTHHGRASLTHTSWTVFPHTHIMECLHSHTDMGGLPSQHHGGSSLHTHHGRSSFTYTSWRESLSWWLFWIRCDFAKPSFQNPLAIISDLSPSLLSEINPPLNDCLYIVCNLLPHFHNFCQKNACHVTNFLMIKGRESPLFKINARTTEKFAVQ